MSIASLVLGIIGVFLCFVVVPSILALVFGLLGINQIKQDPSQSGRGMAIAGIVLGAIGVLLFVLVLIVGRADYTFE
jgi:predicted acyltransferase